MSERILLLQTAKQTLGSLRTLRVSFQNRPSPRELCSVAEALEHIYSKALDELLMVRLSTFSGDPDAGEIATIDDFLYEAEFGLYCSIDGMRHISAQDLSTQDVSTQDVSTQDVSTKDMSTQDVSTQDVSTLDVSTQNSGSKDRISQINHGWKIFSDRIAKVIAIIIVDEEERRKFHPFINRSSMAIKEVAVMSVSSNHATDSRPHERTTSHQATPEANSSRLLIEFRLGSASASAKHHEDPIISDEPSLSSKSSRVSDQSQLHDVSSENDETVHHKTEHDENKHGDDLAEVFNSGPPKEFAKERDNMDNRNALLGAARVWIGDILWKTSGHLSGPISWLLTLIIIYLFIRATGPPIIRGACAKFPRVLYYVPICTPDEVLSDQEPRFKKVIELQAKLIDVHELSVQEQGVPWIIRESELAVGAIKIHVERSQIENKDEIGIVLTEYEQLADSAVHDLMQYHASVNQIVDFSLGVNNWFGRSLQKVLNLEKSPILRIFDVAQSFIPGGTRYPNRERLRSIYIKYTSDIGSLLKDCIREGDAASDDVYALERLFTRAHILMGSGQIRAENEKAELDTIWALIFQQHRFKLHKAKENVEALRAASSSFNKTKKNLSSAVMALREIYAQVEKLSKALENSEIQLEGEALEPYMAMIGGIVERLQVAQQVDKARKQKPKEIDGRQ